MCDYLYCIFMFVLLLPAEMTQLDLVKGDQKAYDLELCPGLLVKAVQGLQGAGV